MVLCTVFTLQSGICAAQTVVTGVATSVDKQEMSGINVLVLPSHNASTMLNFAITDENGRFKLSFQSNADSVFIAFKSLNFRDTTLAIKNQNQELHVILPPDVFEIKEVSVKGYPISIHGDTINYIVNSFARNNDRSIGDVIARMPGFEVTELGQIYYQGKPIQRYYIEGMDLLENRYTLANKNLPHKSVSSVEVMQNHQPIKMLENKIASDGTSINIKLKNDVAITGNMYAGAGFSPFLHDVNLTPMLFNKKQQIIATWQSNNIGDDLNTQHQPLVFSNGELQGSKNRKPELLGILQVSKPQIEKQRYLDNDANLLSYNHLLKIKNGTELKINSSFYHDRIKENGQVATSYFLSKDTVSFSEVTRNKYFNKSLSTELTLTKNEKDKYLTNKFSINKFWDSEEGLIQRESDLMQKAETPHFSLSNEFDVLLPINQNFIRFYSFCDYNNSPQQLTLSPGVFKDVLNNGEPYTQTAQYFNEKNIVTHNFMAFTLSRKPWIFESEPGIRFEHQQLKTAIEKDGDLITADSLQNDLNWNFVELYFSETIKYEKNKIKLSFEFPLNFQNYNIVDKMHTTPQEIEKWLLTPSAHVKYELNGFWTWRMGAKYNQQLGEVSSMAQGYVFSSYRQLKKGINQLSEKKGFQYDFAIEYKSPISGLFYNLKWIGRHSSSNLLLSQQVTGNGLLFYDVVEKDNNSIFENLSFTINRYLANMQATVNFKAYYDHNKKEYILNDQLGWLNNNAFVLNPGISINRWKKVDFGYNYQILLMNQKSEQAKISVTDQKHEGSVFYKPEKRHLLGFSCEFYETHQSAQKNTTTFFANFSYHFKPSIGKLKYRFDVRNIFNHSEIVRFYYSNISLAYNSYSIRPRQFLITVSLGI